MSEDLRIVDAPELPSEQLTDNVKLPTGGKGNYSITYKQLKDKIVADEKLIGVDELNAKVAPLNQSFNQHRNNINNPHNVTKAQLGLGNVDNTSDLNKPVSWATQTAITNATKDAVTQTELMDALEPISDDVSYIGRYTALPYETDKEYALGERVTLANGDVVVNTVAGNTANPNTNRTGWVSFGNSNIVFHGNIEYPEYSPSSYMSVNGVPISRKYDMRNYHAEKPTGFDWDVHGVHAWLDRYGVMQHNLDVTRFDVASKAADVVNYFVKKGGGVTSATTGLDPTQPLGAIYAAINRINANATQNAVIWITPEVYTDGAVWGVTNPIRSNVSVKIWNGSTVEPFNDITDACATITTESTGLVWTSAGSNTYSTTRIAVGAIVDQKVLNKHGDWTLYTKVADLTTCQAQAGTWAQVDSTLYVHTLDNRIPDSLCHVYVAKMNGEAATGDYTFYCERVNFYGGDRAFYGYSENLTSAETLVFNKCAFKYATNNNFETRGSKYTITNLCDANYGGSDGFNYHTSLVATTKISYHLEVNCVAYQNGKSWSNLIGSNNGSTVHDGCYIARFNTIAFENEGPNIADVGGGKSWLFNCQAKDSRNPIVEGTHADFYTSENLMWLDLCDASGSRYGLAATGNARIYMRNTNAYARVFQASKLIDWRTSSYVS